MNRRAAAAAWACAALNLAAAVMMLAWLRPGLPPNPPMDRSLYLTTHGAVWTLGWSAWIAAGLALTAAWYFLGRATGAGAGPALLNLAGNVPDIAAELFYIVKLSDMTPGFYAEWDRWTALLSGTLANGAYTTAWLIVARRLPRAFRLGAAPGIAAGYALSVASAFHVPWAMVASTAVLMSAFVAWITAAGLFFWKKSGPGDRIAARAGPEDGDVLGHRRRDDRA